MTTTTPQVQVCPPDHRHAEVATCYVIHRCRCEPCRHANSARERRRAKLKAYGRWESPYVDAQPAREHVLRLRASGVGYKSIANLAGVSVTSVRALIYGREDYIDGGHGPRHGEHLKRISRDKAERLLALNPTMEQLPRSAHRPARGTVRRVQALIAMGWTIRAIAEAADVDYGSLTRTLRRYEKAKSHRNRVLIRPETIVAVERAYNTLSVTLPSAATHRERISVARMRNIGERNGWPLPMDWEAVDNDFDRHNAVRRSSLSRHAEVAS